MRFPKSQGYPQIILFILDFIGMFQPLPTILWDTPMAQGTPSHCLGYPWSLLVAFPRFGAIKSSLEVGAHFEMYLDRLSRPAMEQKILRFLYGCESKRFGIEQARADIPFNTPFNTLLNRRVPIVQYPPFNTPVQYPCSIPLFNIPVQ